MRCVSVHEEAANEVTILLENEGPVTAGLLVRIDVIELRIRDYLAPSQSLKFIRQITAVAFAKKGDLFDLDEEQTARMIINSEGSFTMVPANETGDQIIFFSTFQTQERTKDQWRELNKNTQQLMNLLQDTFSSNGYSMTVRRLVIVHHRTPFSVGRETLDINLARSTCSHYGKF
jgi:hypothetical protein